MRPGSVVAVACTLAAALAAPCVTPATAHAARAPRTAKLQRSPADPRDPIGDQRLREQIATVELSRATQSSGGRTVSAEVMTHHTDAIAQRVRQLGGLVVGSVDDEVVQVRMPVTAINALALSDGVDFVQATRAVTLPSSLPLTRPQIGPGLGTVVGSNVALTNAQAWQAAGVDGSVKVGIIDYFDRLLWVPAEEGPVPDAAHIFCQDTFEIPISVCSPVLQAGVINGLGFEHGVAVAQVVKDMAPAAELYLATVSTASDLRAAIDWFAQNGVQIVTRSLGAALDGPGDGTGPLDSVVDYAAGLGITWFNSVGNDAVDDYVRVSVPVSLDYPGTVDDGYVDFDGGPGVDTFLRVNGGCFTLLDGVRWSDWDLPANQRTDYVFEAYEPLTDPDIDHRIANPSNPAATVADENFNPADLRLFANADNNQNGGAPPLEEANGILCPTNSFGADHGISYVRLKRKAHTPTVGALDIMEFALGSGLIEHGRAQAAYSASKPISDSRNPMLVSVGAIDPAIGRVNPGGRPAIASYSSQGPTNDGRIKPEVSAPSCIASTIYHSGTNPSCFNGTSAASPTVAGMAALLLDAGIATAGAPLGAAVKHFTFDRNVEQGNLAPLDGPDNTYGIGQVLLPAPPPVRAPSTPSAYVPLVPTRVLDTRPSSPVGPAVLVGTHRPYDIVDLAVTDVGGVSTDATAVAINLTSVEAPLDGYIQVLPYLRSAYGSSSTMNIVVPQVARANFAIVPVGVDGKISIYTVPGGQLIVDLLGYFKPAAASVSAGRVVPIVPERVLDTRTTNFVPPGWIARKPFNEPVQVPAAIGVPTAGVAALVLNVTSTEAISGGYLRAQPTGSAPSSSTVNYVAGIDSANSVIVPLGADGTVSIFSNNAAHIVVDVTGYVTGPAAPVSAVGLFVPIVTGRAYDSRIPPELPLAAEVARSVSLAGLAAPLPFVPVGASAVSINLTAADETDSGFVSAYPSGTTWPGTSSLNYQWGQPVANGAVLKLSARGALDLLSNVQIAIIIDVNGYFT